MKEIKTGLISPNGEVHSMNYYELGLYAKKICEQYINESKQNEEVFKQFSKKYHYFKPYFDFVIFKLGYKIINPFLKEDTIGYAIGNFFVTKSLKQKSGIEKYTSVSDQDLQITNYKDTSIKEGFIDPNGIGFKVNRKIEMGHAKVGELILNQLMIYESEVYEDYVRCMSDKDINCFITRIEFYMVERLGFTHMCIFDTNYGNVIYNDLFNIPWIGEFQERYKKEYPNISFLPISEEINLDLEPLNVRKIG